mmetsp:Transcript_26883/g.64156  ORF Transcript_26883/g.64156 Transcript_26883/m.64156 type:complete len:205 (+) Transcript_26883:2177-2791(+)
MARRGAEALRRSPLHQGAAVGADRAPRQPHARGCEPHGDAQQAGKPPGADRPQGPPRLPSERVEEARGGAARGDRRPPSRRAGPGAGVLQEHRRPPAPAPRGGGQQRPRAERRPQLPDAPVAAGRQARGAGVVLGCRARPAPLRGHRSQARRGIGRGGDSGGQDRAHQGEDAGAEPRSADASDPPRAGGGGEGVRTHQDDRFQA